VVLTRRVHQRVEAGFVGGHRRGGSAGRVRPEGESLRPPAGAG
jgi:hypothetical protein